MPAQTAAKPGRFSRLRRVRAQLERVPGFHVTLSAVERDRRLGGPLLAGALAFRLFAVMLPLSLLVAVGIGYAATVNRAAPSEAGKSLGIGQAALESIAQSSKLSTSAAWLVGGTAIVALLYASFSAAKAIHAAHCLAWYGSVKKIER